MQILSCALVFSVCVWAAVAHNKDGESAAEVGRSKTIWEEPIQFVTKTKDKCSMILTGHGELTRLRVSCAGHGTSYWCEYEGKPDTCRNYNTNPRHFFTQIMWELRKLTNACQGPQNLKPTMCKKASDESQMVFTTGSSATAAKPDQAKPEQIKPAPTTSVPRSDQSKLDQKQNGAMQKPTRQKPAKPQPTRTPLARQANPKTEQVKAERVKPENKTTTHTKVLAPKAATQAPIITAQAPTRSAENLAQQYCWHGMHGLCTKVISWFTR